ncbi:MAG: putative peroxidase-related enzyme [Granulosicoccus sp.]|jgi:uncharacterized peroxidase-related enzyme
MKNKICWIDVQDNDDADAELKRIYDRVRCPEGQLDNLYQGFSLRPHTILPADDLYLAAMHHADNILPKWLSELIGTYVAILTGCDYASAHHGYNYSYLIDDQDTSEKVLTALKRDDIALCGDEHEVAVLRYVRQLCMEPASIEKQHVDTLTQAGWSDGEILEIVQLVAMFSYFVRVINGVGIQLGNEKLGLY